MTAYYISQGYDAPSTFIWSVLTDFETWPAWFPRMTALRVDDGGAPGHGAELLAVGEADDEWTRWRIAEWSEPSLLVCEYLDSNVSVAHGVDAAYLQFELADDPDGCTLDVEIGASGQGMVSDFFVGMTLGMGVRRLLPQLVDAFSDYVVERAGAS
jgi:hypothetical protein